MHPQPQPTALLPHQTRMIDAREGLLLEVVEGCLWLTRPGDESDRFLYAGSRIVLTQNSVLIQCDRHPAQAAPRMASYRLVALADLQAQQPQCAPLAATRSSGRWWQMASSWWAWPRWTGQARL